MNSRSSQDARHATTKVTGLEQFDGSRFAIMMPQICRRPFRGRARYERDDLLGNVLRIAIETDNPGDPHILIAEDQWDGLIKTDSRFGCDYFVVLPPDP